jgi:hypothetical protein
LARGQASGSRAWGNLAWGSLASASLAWGKPASASRLRPGRVGSNWHQPNQMPSGPPQRRATTEAVLRYGIWSDESDGSRSPPAVWSRFRRDGTSGGGRDGRPIRTLLHPFGTEVSGRFRGEPSNLPISLRLPPLTGGLDWRNPHRVTRPRSATPHGRPARRGRLPNRLPWPALRETRRGSGWIPTSCPERPPRDHFPSPNRAHHAPLSEPRHASSSTISPIVLVVRDGDRRLWLHRECRGRRGRPSHRR